MHRLAWTVVQLHFYQFLITMNKFQIYITKHEDKLVLHSGMSVDR